MRPGTYTIYHASSVVAVYILSPVSVCMAGPYLLLNNALPYITIEYLIGNMRLYGLPFKNVKKSDFFQFVSLLRRTFAMNHALSYISGQVARDVYQLQIFCMYGAFNIIMFA